ncbi:peptidoglycan-binding domain-containing protein [Streptomyces sp. NRRL B-24085]|uniref:peptidoglycan-binding domain-containing protein n=2 Tax=Streptomyces sp. NRRL B-24085 TaxID=1709476 RepID=UPI000A3A97D0|nr:peptidoglycan-binding domain-containing protein [Streptomyces sp. NRRL B-24085]
MAESNGHLCPECGAPRGADNTPSCGCTRRASDALRDARTAEAAAAEDFDPLRIRPYVELDEETAPVPRVPAPEATRPLRAPTPTPPPSAPSPTDLSLFASEEDLSAPGPAPDPRSRRTRRRTVLLASAGAVVAVVAAAGIASGLFAYDPPSRDEAAPRDVRPAVPDVTTTAPSASPTAPTPSVRPSSAPPSATASASPSASPSPSESSAFPGPSHSAAPSASPTASTATKPAAGADSAEEAAPPVLRRGSEGPEVVELELRLTQVGLYGRKPSGHYNEGVEDAVAVYQWQRGLQGAERGVYDLPTRERLESETREP